MSKQQPQRRFTVIPIRVSRTWGKFRLGEFVFQAIRSAGEKLQDNDIVVVSSKFAAMAEGRVVDLRTLTPSEQAKKLSSKFALDPSLAELIVRESDAILGGIPGFALAVSKGILAPNAGIDRSNVPHNYAILYPKNPSWVAQKLRLFLEKRFSSRHSLRLGIILSDSRITPTRTGTIGIAIATSGFKPVIDFRGRKDLFGNKLKVTMKAVADQLSSAAQLVMGEATESTPIVIIRGYLADMDERGSIPIVIDYEKCLYIQGLKNGYEG